MICPHCLSAVDDSPCSICGGTFPRSCQPPPAGVPGRFLALVLDGIFCLLPAFIALAVMVFTNPELKESVLAVADLAGLLGLYEAKFFLPFAISGGLVGVFGFVNLAILMFSGQTVGKKLLDYKVMDRQGEVASAGRLLLREIIGKPLSGALAGIGYLMAFFTDRHQALHDYLAGTFVVRKLHPGEMLFSKAPASGAKAPYPVPPRPVVPVAVDIHTPPPAPPAYAEPPAPAYEMPVSPGPGVASFPPPPLPPPAPAPGFPPDLPPAGQGYPAPASAVPFPAPPPPAAPPVTPAYPPPAFRPSDDEEPSLPSGRVQRATVPIESFAEMALRHCNRFCPACKAPMEDNQSLTCLVCGFEQLPQAPTDVALEKCPKCGDSVPALSRFCNHCGLSLLPDATPVVPLVVKAAEDEAVPSPTLGGTPGNRARLISFSSEGEKEVFAITKPRTRIGRSSDNDISFVGEKAISHRHCEIFFEDGVFHIRDLGSTNGVYVNNEKVESSPLVDGDKVKLGFKVFRFTL